METGSIVAKRPQVAASEFLWVPLSLDWAPPPFGWSVSLEVDPCLSRGSRRFTKVVVEVPTKVSYKCIEEYKTSMDFDEELVEASSTGFIQDIEDCKAHLKKMVMKLAVRHLHLDNSDEEVRVFFSDEY